MKRRHESSSTGRKTRKLLELIEEAEQQIAELDSEKRRVRREEREVADESKLQFLRSAATIQRTIDENGEELQRLRAETERDEPQFIELRKLLSEQLEQHSARKDVMEQEKREKLSSLRAEIAEMHSLRSAEIERRDRAADPLRLL